MLDYDTENLNSDEIYSSLRGVTEAIEKFSFRSQEDLNEPIKRDGKKDSDIVSVHFGLWMRFKHLSFGLYRLGFMSPCM